MYELFIALKYLVPKKRSLSTSLISCLSTFVISLVVWLVLVFLSVTTGIEKRWVNKLTSLNAPIRITPTKHSYESLSPEDLQKTYSVLSNLQNKIPGFTFQDFEISGALLKLFLKRSDEGGEKVTYLSQMSYLLSLTDKNPKFASLLLPPSEKDLSAIMQNASDTSSFFKNIELKKVSTKPLSTFSLSSLSKSFTYDAFAFIQKEHVVNLILPTEKTAHTPSSHFTHGSLRWEKDSFVFQVNDTSYPIDLSSFQLSSPLILSVLQVLPLAPELSSPHLEMEGTLQGLSLKTQLPLSSLHIHQASLRDVEEPKDLFWATSFKNKVVLPERYSPAHTPILLPKSLQDSGARIGDLGTLSYAATTFTAPKEQRLSVIVSGFYDPGILPVGNKFLIVPSYITQTINASSALFLPDNTSLNGLYVWFSDQADVKKVKKQVMDEFDKENISSFWNIQSFHEYEFSKDLMDQFQSDRTLFTLIALIILVVACSNIISLLVLLVNDKKKEIAILQAMGASKYSIACIFGILGTVMGVLSSLLGSVMAIFTLQHLNWLVKFLSIIQGHSAFNPSFFGSTLPNELSFSALLFILIATPFIALISGLIPAIKATKLCPSNILRSSE